MNKSVWRIFVFTLVFAPLAFGTVEQWSLTIMEILPFVALSLYIKGRSSTKRMYETPGLVPLLLFLGYILLQLVPMPMAMMQFISPATHKLYFETVGIVDPGGWVSLSIHKKATLSEFYRFAAYVAFYVLTVQLLSQKELLRKTLVIVVSLSTILAVLAILQKFTSPDTIYWFRKVAKASATGPYVYHNHYAGFMEMLFPVVASLFFFYKPRVVYEKSIRERFVVIFNQHGSYLHILLGFSAILIAASVFVSLSRGGILSLSFALLFLGAMLLRNREASKKRIWFYLLLPVLIVVSVGWFGWEPILARFEKLNVDGRLYELRLDFWRDSINIIRDYFLFGTGFGTYVDIYPGYRTIAGNLILDHAHNDYIELMTNGGVVGFLLVAFFLGAVFRKSYKVFLRRREAYSIYLYFGCVTGLLAIFIHSLSDFNMYNGANGLYFFFLAGVFVSATNTRLRGRSKHTYLQEVRFFWSHPVTISLLASLGISCLIFNIGILGGKVRFSAIENIYLNENIPKQKLTSIRDAAEGAAKLDLLEAKYHFAMANVDTFLLNKRSAVTQYKKAITLNPAKGEYLQRLGFFMAVLQENNIAGRLLKAGVITERSDPQKHKDYAKWLFSHGEKEQGINSMKTAISLNPKKINEYIYLMALYRVSDNEIGRAIPAEATPQLYYAEYLATIGRDDLAENAYFKMLTCLKNDSSSPSTWYFDRFYNFYMKNERYDEALSAMLNGIEFFPKNAKFRYTAATLYERLEITYRAKEEYQKALILDPGNATIQKRLNRLLEQR